MALHRGGRGGRRRDHRPPCRRPGERRLVDLARRAHAAVPCLRLHPHPACVPAVGVVSKLIGDAGRGGAARADRGRAGRAGLGTEPAAPPAAGRAFVALGGHVGLPDPRYFPAIIAPFAAATAVHVLANHALVWGMLRLAGGSLRPRRQVEASALMLLVSDLCYAALGLVIAALWVVMGPLAPALALVPLFVARWAMGQYAEQQRAYAATMAALCQAVETKDFYTRGHSERVSRGSGMIARQIRMRPDRAEAIMIAGMLHDVGKLGVPTKVLQKTGPLTEEEYAAIQLHPMRGLEIVREIGFLNEALAGIMHHHERIDGRGYPMGFAGDETPEFARIIAVADAFDSMTSARSYREARRIHEAVEELRRGAGTQFDPVMVDAFIAALHRDGWRLPGPQGTPAAPETVTAQDHDDPTAPLRVIESA